MESKSVILKTGEKNISDAIARATNISHLALNQISPGLRVNATIDKMCSNGFTATFMGLFHGCIDVFSMATPSSQSIWRDRYLKDDLVAARVVFVDHASKSIRLSLRPHVLAMRAPKPALPPLGSILSGFSVCIPFKKAGILASRPSAGNDGDETDGSDEEDGDGDEKKKRRVIQSGYKSSR